MYESRPVLRRKLQIEVFGLTAIYYTVVLRDHASCRPSVFMV